MAKSQVLVMDYASGGTLRQRHPHGSYLSLQATVAYVKQMASALHVDCTKVWRNQYVSLAHG